VAKKALLIVDDEPNIRRILQVAFEKTGYSVGTAEDGAQALKTLETGAYDCVLTDVTMPVMTGYELLREVKSKSDTPVVIMTAFGTIPQAVQAIRDGAFEYVTKPFDLEHLKRIVEAAIASSSVKPSTKAKTKTHSKDLFIAESPAMKEIAELVHQIADSRATVLITGESGVGKEVISRAIHRASSRNKQKFVAVSCAALPETLLESELFGYEKGAFTGATGAKLGRFELAHLGTLMLDEIGDIPMSVQVKLLRVLQEREFEKLGSNSPTKVDVRLITATNRNLQEAVDEGIFRLDLLYRLQVVEIHIPSLRERVEDILPLAQHFLAKHCQENGRPAMDVGAEALSALQAYPWPGNVRELENAMERATVLAQPQDTELSLRLLPPTLKKAA
jgi:DNA-binding NtrC family response regulator